MFRAVSVESVVIAIIATFLPSLNSVNLTWNSRYGDLFLTESQHLRETRKFILELQFSVHLTNTKLFNGVSTLFQ